MIQLMSCLKLKIIENGETVSVIPISPGSFSFIPVIFPWVGVHVLDFIDFIGNLLEFLIGDKIEVEADNAENEGAHFIDALTAEVDFVEADLKFNGHLGYGYAHVPPAVGTR